MFSILSNPHITELQYDLVQVLLIRNIWLIWKLNKEELNKKIANYNIGLV